MTRPTNLRPNTANHFVRLSLRTLASGLLLGCAAMLTGCSATHELPQPVSGIYLVEAAEPQNSCGRSSNIGGLQRTQVAVASTGNYLSVGVPTQISNGPVSFQVGVRDTVNLANSACNGASRRFRLIRAGSNTLVLDLEDDLACGQADPCTETRRLTYTLEQSCGSLCDLFDTVTGPSCECGRP